MESFFHHLGIVIAYTYVYHVNTISDTTTRDRQLRPNKEREGRAKHLGESLDIERERRG
jgi:hypothetical protein